MATGECGGFDADVMRMGGDFQQNIFNCANMSRWGSPVQLPSTILMLL
jgi:hypothetical protein